MPAVNNWEMIANNLGKRGWSLGWVSAVDSERRTIWIVDGSAALIGKVGSSHG